MRQYSAEFKASLIAKMLPPHNRPVPDLARETQIPRDTLYSWRTQALKAGGDLVPAPTPDERDSAAKFAIVIETAHLNAEELSTYCRRQGLYPQQIDAWRSACVQANAPVCGQAERAQRRSDQQRIKLLEQEVGRKDKALAEAAALLMLQKKLRLLLADRADA
jgi:transposase-like protein